MLSYNRNNKLRLRFLALSRFNRPFWATATILFFVIFILFSIIGIINFHQLKLWQSKGNVYGYFYSIVYQNKEDQYNNLLNDWKSIEALKIRNQGTTVNLHVGTYEKGTESLMYWSNPPIHFVEVEDGECTISLSLAEELGKKEGDKFVLSDVELKITSIVPNIGFLWAQGDSEVKSDIKVPRIWVNKNTFDKLKNSGDDILFYKILLLDYPQTNEFLNLGLRGNIYENANVFRDENLFVLRFPRSFFAAQLIAFFIIVLLVLKSYNSYSLKRYMTYEMLGMGGRELRGTARAESLLAIIPSFLLGVFVACLVNFVFAKYVLLDSSIFSASRFLKYVSIYVYVLLAAICIHIVFIDYNFSFSCRLKNKKRIYLRSIEILALLAPLGILLTFMVISYCSSLTFIEHRARKVELQGQFDKSYDYELKYVPRSIVANHYLYGSELVNVNTAGEMFPFIFDYHNEELDNIIPKIYEIEGVKDVNCFCEIYDGYIDVDEEVICSPFIEKVHLGKCLWVANGPFVKKYLSDKNDEFVSLIKLDLIAVPDSYLKSLSSMAGLDDISTESLISGESGLLISPSVKITKIEKDEYGETVYWKYSVSDEQLTKDDKLPNYKEMTVFTPVADKNLIGLVPQQELLNLNAMLKKTVIPLAGYTYENIGWFAEAGNIASPYRMIVSKKLLEKQGIKHEITRVEIIQDFNANHYQVAEKIQHLIRDIPFIKFLDQYYDVEVLHEFEKIKSIISILYLVLFSILLISFVVTIGHFFWLQNISNFRIYRDIGITKRKLLGLCLRPTSIILLCAFVIQIIISEYLYANLIHGWGLYSMRDKFIIQLIVFLSYFLGIAFTLFVFISGLMKQHDYFE